MNSSSMGWFRHLTIGQKFLVSFGLILSLLILSLTAILVYLARVNSYVDRHQRITVPAVVTAASMQRAVFEMDLALRLFLQTSASSNREETIRRVNLQVAALKTSLELYRTTHAARTHPILLGMLRDHQRIALADQEDKALEQMEKVLNEITATWTRAQLPATPTQYDKTDAAFEQLMDALDQLVDAHTKIDVEMKLEGDALVARARLVALALVLLLAAVITATYIGVTRHIARPLQSLAGTADRVARQDLSASFEPWATRDEVGTLAGSLATMLTTLRDQTKALERKTQELEAFTYSVAHDLKAPLREIEGFSALLQKKFGSAWEPTAKEYLEKVHGSSLRMTALIDALLRYSRLEQQNLPMSHFNLREMVEAIVTDRLAGLPTHTPKFTVALTVESLVGEPVSIRQALMNLLDNAIKFSRQAETPEIVIGGKKTAGETVLWVRDNGIGFDPRNAEKIFGLFERLHPHQEYEGTGVGLAIVKLVMNKHSGRVWVESSPGKGSTFYLAFPK